MTKSAIVVLLCVGFLLAHPGTAVQAQTSKRLPLKEGVWQTDALKATDEVDRVVGAPCKEYEIEFKAQETYIIEMETRCPQFDAFLRLKDVDGRQWASDDDGGQGFNARIVFTCTQSGKYVVVATTYGGDVGAFAVVVRKSANPWHGVVRQSDSFASADRQQVRGLKRVERPVRVYPVTLYAGARYRFEAASNDINTWPVLLLRTPENWVRGRDDNPTNARRAQVDYHCSETGVYFILVTTTEPHARGDFELQITELPAKKADK